MKKSWTILSILFFSSQTKLQKIFESEKKAIENRYHQQLKAKSEELQQTLVKERKQRVAVSAYRISCLHYL